MGRLCSYLVVGAALGLNFGCSSSSPGAAAGKGGTASTGVSGSTAIGGGGTASTGVSGSTAIGSGGGSTGSEVPTGTMSAAVVAAKLGRPTRFLIGMGNDLNNDHSMDGAYTVGTTLDLHYAYMVGLIGKGGWPDWNAGGTFVNVLTDSADAKGVVPMFTLYAMASVGDGNLAGLADNSFEKPYWDSAKLLFQRLGAFGKPAVVHLEPDFWGYAEQQSKEDPSSMKVNVTANAPDCAGMSDDLVGMGHCLVHLSRLYAPKTLIGFHASEWAGDPTAMVKFLNAVGSDEADVVFADLLDRDAGCFEAATDPNCKRGGTFYWDETNTTSPNFHDYLAWSTAISTGLGRPMIWWQIPFGVPSTTPGGTEGHYRDNRVHYIFSHIAEFVAAGGLGATFGTGADKQTSIDTDGGQFKNAVAGYFKAPVALP